MENYKSPDFCVQSSCQFQNKEIIYVTILKVIDPSHFLIKEAPSQLMSKEAKKFLDLSEDIQFYCEKCYVMPSNPELPVRGKIVLVYSKSKELWCRAEILDILESSKGACINVFLVDYGEIINTNIDEIRKLLPSHLEVPFQAFHLFLCLKPKAFKIRDDMTFGYMPTEKWDIAAISFVKKLIDETENANIVVNETGEQRSLYGKLYLQQGGRSLCLNDLLIEKKFACNADKSVHEVSESQRSNSSLSNASKREYDNLTIEQKAEKERAIYKEISQNLLESKQCLADKIRVQEKNDSRRKTYLETRERSSLVSHDLSGDLDSDRSQQLSDHRSRRDIFDTEVQFNCANPDIADSLNKQPNSSFQESLLKKKLSSHTDDNENKEIYSKSKTVDNVHSENKEIFSKSKIVDNVDFPPTENVRSPRELDKIIINYVDESSSNISFREDDSFDTSESVKESGAKAKNVSSPLTVNISPSPTSERAKNLLRILRKSTPKCSSSRTSSNSDEASKTPFMQTENKSPPKCSSSRTSPYSDEASKTPFTQDENKSFLAYSKSLVTNEEDRNLPESIVKKDAGIPSKPQEKIFVQYENVQFKNCDDKSEMSNSSFSSENPNSNEDFMKHNDQNIIPESKSYSGTIPKQKVISESSALLKILRKSKSICPVPRNLSQETEKCSLLNNKFRNSEKFVLHDEPSLHEVKELSSQSDTITTKSALAESKYIQGSLARLKKYSNTVSSESNSTSHIENCADENDSNVEDLKLNTEDCSEQINSRDGILTSQNSSISNSVTNLNENAISNSLRKPDHKIFAQLLKKHSNVSSSEKKKSSFPDSVNFSQTKIKELRLPELNYVESQEFPMQMEYDQPFCDRWWLKCLRDGIGKTRFLNPVMDICDIPFASHIKNKLKEFGFPAPSLVQSLVWPAVFRSQNIAVVAPEHSGKTLACILPTMSQIIQPTLYEGLPTSSGPLLLILCPSWKKAQTIYDQCKMFLKELDNIKVKLIHGGGAEKDKEASLIDGCEILIATPPCFLRFLRRVDDFSIINLNRCCHLFIDDADIVIKTFTKEISEITRDFLCCHQKRGRETSLAQILLCSEHWTPAVKSYFTNCMPNPQLLITSFLEAAIYGNLPVHIQMCPSSLQDSKLLDLVKRIKHQKKIVICTINSETATKVHDILKCSAVYSYLIHEKMPMFDISGVLRRWKCSASSVLVLSDKADHDIEDADCLIHYDIPEFSRREFNQRFSCLKKSFPSFADLEKGYPVSYVSHVIVTEKCGRQAPYLVYFMKRLNCDIPPELLKLKYLVEKNINETCVELCNDLKKFGQCFKGWKCRSRHVVNEKFDKQKYIPAEGEVKIIILNVIDATQYYGRLLYHKDNSGNKKYFDANYAEIQIKMNRYYSNQNNHKPIESPCINDLYTVRKPGNIYHRVQVKDIYKSGRNMPLKLNVHFVDEGWREKVDASVLLDLPKDLACLHFQAVEVIICNIKPLDNDHEWTRQAGKFVHELIAGKESIGRIVLSLGNTLWLKPFYVQRWLESTKTFINVNKVDSTLIEASYALRNDDHLKFLQQICSGKIDLFLNEKSTLKLETFDSVDKLEVTNEQQSMPSQNTVIDEIRQLSSTDAKDDVKEHDGFLKFNAYQEIQIASLKINAETCVSVTAVQSPHLFYVNDESFKEEFDSVMKKINNLADKNCLQKCEVVETGMLCLAPFQDGVLNRARVLRISKSSNVSEVRVFYFDYGNFGTALESQIYLVPLHLLIFPAQAIKCELSGVETPKDGWTNEAVDAFFDLVENPDGSMKLCTLKVLSEVISSNESNHYVVELFDHVKKTSISQELNEWLQLHMPLYQANTSRNSVASSDDFLPEEKECAAGLLACLAYAKNLQENYTYDAKGDTKNVNSETQVNSQSSSYMMRNNVQIDQLYNPNAVYVPNVFWWQTDNEIKISIKLIDVQEYELNVLKDRIIFSTYLKEHQYGVDLSLYEEINPDMKNVNKHGQSVDLSLMKIKKAVWPRLLSTTAKVSSVKYDPDHLEDNDVLSERSISVVSTEFDGTRTPQSVLPYDESSPEEDEYIDTYDIKKLTDTYDPYDPMF